MYYSQKVEQTIDDFRKQIVSLKSLDDFIAARKNIYRVLEQEINNDKIILELKIMNINFRGRWLIQLYF
jgi:hypothetical protein